MAGPLACFNLERGFGSQEQGRGAEREDANEVGAEVRREDVLACWVENDFMDVRRGLTVGIWSSVI